MLTLPSQVESAKPRAQVKEFFVDIKKMADLARVQLTEPEIEAFAVQFEQIFNYFEKISTIDTTGIPPMVTPIEVQHQLRSDEVKAWPGKDKALKQAPELSGRLFKVPPVI